MKITPAAIYAKTSDYEILMFYLYLYTNGRNLKAGELILSPLRKETTASFNIFKVGDQWLFKDYGGEQGNCFKLIMLLFNLSFPQALEKINLDMNLGISDNNSVVEDSTNIQKIIYGNNYKIYVKKFTRAELQFWQQFKITEEVLKLYNVFSIDKLQAISKRTEKPYSISSNSTRFIFGYDYGNGCIKIYQPNL